MLLAVPRWHHTRQAALPCCFDSLSICCCDSKSSDMRWYAAMFSSFSRASALVSVLDLCNDATRACASPLRRPNMTKYDVA